MINHLKRLYHQYQLYRNYFNNLRQHNSFKQNRDRSSADIEQKTVGFDIEDNRFTRHLYNFIIFFILSGYKVYVKKRVSFIGNLTDYSSKYLLKTKNLFLVNQLPPGIYLKFSTKKKQGFVGLNDNFLSLKKAEKQSMTYPFSMHPIIYKNHYVDEIEELRKSTKKIRIFFAGAIGKDYEHGNFRELFNIIDRYKLFQVIAQHYSREDIIIIKTKEELELFGNKNYLNKIVMMKSEPLHLVGIDKWLPLLAQADFFLAMPGVKIPLCHNLIEAMSLGVIPILQYFDFLAVPLENYVNCIMFKTKDELYEKIDEIKRMNNPEIKKLRDGVINYYETWLKPQKFINRIEQQMRDRTLKNIYLYSELNTVNRFKIELKDGI